MGLQDRRFSDEIDKLTGYKTKSLLCMPIRNSDGEIIGVAQAINKSSSGELFTEDDEKVNCVVKVTSVNAAVGSLDMMVSGLDVQWRLRLCQPAPNTPAGENDLFQMSLNALIT